MTNKLTCLILLVFPTLLHSGCSDVASCKSEGEVLCVEDRVHTVDSCGNVLEEMEHCPCGCRDDGLGCEECGCTDACPGEGEGQCADGELRTCEVGADGCLVWGSWDDCPSSFCIDSSTCGVCNNGCDAQGATQCTDGAVRSCQADLEGCLFWGDYADCPEGFCGDTESCGGCDNACGPSGSTLCAEGMLQTCTVDENGCLLWSAAMECPEGFCADSESCGVCDDLCPSPGVANCSNGEIQICMADAKGCLDWGEATACPEGFCADSESCGGCENECSSAGSSSCSDGEIRSCVVDQNGCLNWGEATACHEGFCTDSENCGSCENDCTLEDAFECQDGLFRTCRADANGCLNWGDFTPCPSGACESETACILPPCGAGSLEWLVKPVHQTSTYGGFSAKDMCAHSDASVTITAAYSYSIRLGGGTENEIELNGGSYGRNIMAHFSPQGRFEWLGNIHSAWLYEVDTLPGEEVGVSGSFTTVAVFNSELPNEFRLNGDEDEADAFIAVVSPGGEVRWARQIIESDALVVRGPAAHHDGSLAIGGRYGMFSGLLQLEDGMGGWFELQSDNRWESGFIALYDVDGVLQWAYSMDGSSREDMLISLKRLANGDVVAIGEFQDDITLYGTDSELTLTGDPFSSIFVVRYSSDGAILWGRVIDGANVWTAEPKLDDTISDTILIGLIATPDTRFSVGEADEITHLNEDGTLGQDPVLARYALDGSLLSVKSIGEAMTFGEIATTPDGNVIVAPQTGERFGYESQINTASGPLTLPTTNYSSDLVLACTSDDTTAAWTRRVAGDGNDQVNTLVTLPHNDFIVAGTTESYVEFESDQTPGLSHIGGFFLAKYSADPEVPVQLPPPTITLAEPCATPLSCPAMATHTRPFTRGVYYRGSLDGECETRSLQKIHPAVSQDILGPFDCDHGSYSFRPSDDALVAINSGIELYDDGSWVRLTDVPCREYGFTAQDELFCYDHLTIRDADGRAAVGSVKELLGVFADGRLLVRRTSVDGGCPYNSDVVVATAQDEELARMVPRRSDYSGCLSIHQVSVDGDEAYILTAFPVDQQHTLALYHVGSDNVFTHLRDILVDELGEWTLPLCDGSVVQRTEWAGNRVIIYEPGSTQSRVLWDNSSPGPVEIENNDQGAIGP